MDETSHSNQPSADTSSAPPRSWLSIALMALAGLAVLLLLGAMLLPNVRSVPEAGRRNSCQLNMKQIALALRNYEAEYGVLPPAYTVDAEGRPLHSWRTLILPYLAEGPLYDSIDLSKAWDDPVNADARQAYVDAYLCPSLQGPDSHTTYLAVVTPDSYLRAAEPRKLADITDRTASTLLVIEVDEDHAVEWMAPVDADESLVLSLGPGSKFDHAGGSHAAFADGHVSFLQWSDELSAGLRRAMISIAGNDDAVLKEGLE